MNSTTLALVTVLLCGTLAGCKPPPAPPAPAMEEAPPAPVEPAAAPEPAMPDAAAAPAGGSEAVGTEAPADTATEDDDTPHSGGDKVGTGGN